ncbi:MAG: pilus assembly protein N-terminal domain-containing protein, partial [Xanthobacteraceae bacterium]
MTRARSIRAAAALAPLLVAACLVPRALAGSVVFNTPPAEAVHVAASDYQSQPMSLGIGKSVVVDLPRDVKDVLVADPKIANAVVRSSRRA